MGRILMRKPRKKNNPYEIPGLHLSVYSPEELVYAYYHNLPLLEETVMERRLVEWLKKQGEAELAKQLQLQMDRQETAWSMEMFMGAIFEGISYYTPEEIAKAKTALAEWAEADPYARRKEKSDYFLREKRIYEAVNGYETLLAELEGQADELESRRRTTCALKAAVWHNLGVAYAQLFLFAKAAEAFQNAWKLSEAADSKELYMLSLRMSLTKKDYVNRIGEEHLGEAAAMDLEEKLLTLFKKEEKYEGRLRLEAIKEQKELGNQTYYQTALKELVGTFKNQWRNCDGDF